ncbi:MAG TPA: hypothetical protein VMT15_21900 [Bryobacteraceae bacterium]|nr:hypothetical protein [Bryobacteraceae bacterium]
MNRKTRIGMGILAMLAAFAASALADTQFRVRPMVRNDIPPGRGVCEIRLQVDDTIEVALDGDRVFIRTLAGQDARDEGSACNMPLPGREVAGFNFEIREARTRDIQLVEPPARENRGRVVVRIHDGPGGFGRYIFVVSWNMGPERREGDDRRGPDRKEEYRGELRIVRAVWGIPGRDRDVTRLLQDRVHEGRLRIRATNEDIGFDPAYGSVKSLFVEYEIRGRRQEVRVPEGEFLQIPEERRP